MIRTTKAAYMRSAMVWASSNQVRRLRRRDRWRRCLFGLEGFVKWVRASAACRNSVLTASAKPDTSLLFFGKLWLSPRGSRFPRLLSFSRNFDFSASRICSGVGVGAARDSSIPPITSSVLPNTGLLCLSWPSPQAAPKLGWALVTLLVAEVRPRRIVVPTLPVVERLALPCRARARRKAHAALSADLTPEQRLKLDGLLDSRGETRQTYLGWVRQSLGAANPTNILSCRERLIFLRSLGIPVTWSARLHQNRLMQIAREGAKGCRASGWQTAPPQGQQTMIFSLACNF